MSLHTPKHQKKVEPYFNETGSNCPSVLPRAQQAELIDLGVKSVLVRCVVFVVCFVLVVLVVVVCWLCVNVACVDEACLNFTHPNNTISNKHKTKNKKTQKKALGFQLGVFHVELKQTSRGARLIEVNCRMGGGPVW